MVGAAGDVLSQAELQGRLVTVPHRRFVLGRLGDYVEGRDPRFGDDSAPVPAFV